jgi:hypothetical protein
METQLKVDRKELVESLGGEAVSAAWTTRPAPRPKTTCRPSPMPRGAKNGKTYPTVADHENRVATRAIVAASAGCSA